MAIDPTVFRAYDIRGIYPDPLNEEIAWKTKGTAEYQELARRSLATLKPCTPLTEIPAVRGEKKSTYKTLADTKGR